MSSILRAQIAVRAYMRRKDNGKKSPARAIQTESPSNAHAKWSHAALVFDTETTVDASQRFTFGSAQYCRWEGPRAVCVDEYLIYADELPEEDPTGFAELVNVLDAYYRRVLSGRTEEPGFHLLSRREFLKDAFYYAAQANVLFVAYNAPFDFSRLAIRAGECNGRYYGGFSLHLFDYLDRFTGTYKRNTYRPWVGIKHLDSKRAFMGFINPRRDESVGRGRVLDLRTLVSALTGRSLSLADACKLFRTPELKEEGTEHGRITQSYIEYNRQDVRATVALLEKAREEYDRHPIDLDPCEAYSSASIARAYQRAAGVIPPAVKFTAIGDELIGRATAAYYGGRAEIRIRKTGVPVVYCDVVSMYPCDNANLGIWTLLAAARLTAVDVTEEINDLLATVTVADVFQRAFWKRLCVFCDLIPDGHILPCRAQYASEAEGWGIGINPVFARQPLCYPLPDVVAAVLFGRKPIRVTRAIRLVPEGVQQGLRPVMLGGRVLIDPARDDFFRKVIEERKGLAARTDITGEDRARLEPFLKLLANAGSYGVYAQINPKRLQKKKQQRVTIFGLDGPFEVTTRRPEDPGEYSYLPIASLTTSGARLMLALLERSVADRGGHYVMADTDSMAIVATRNGGSVACVTGDRGSAGHPDQINCLTWKDVEDIVQDFEQLNPYDKTLVKDSLLKIEKEENYTAAGEQRQIFAYAISAKRYALYTLSETGEVTVIKASEHGLGLYRNPKDPSARNVDWITETWHYLICQELGLSCAEPEWLDQPAIGRLGITSPVHLAAFKNLNERRSYRKQIKPFNFILSAFVSGIDLPADADPKKFHLVAPYERDSRKWLKMPWFDKKTGARYYITTAETINASLVRVKSFRDVLQDYKNHAEAKSLGPFGAPCDADTRGLLQRRPVHVDRIVYIGKESNHHEDVEAGLVHDVDEVVDCYFDNTAEWHNVLLPFLRTLTPRDAEQKTGLTGRAARALRNGHATPSRRTRERLRRLCSADGH